MRNVVRSSMSAAVALSALGAAAFTAQLPAQAQTTPRWVLHVEHYPGGISNGVRAYASSDLSGGSATTGGVQAQSTAPTLSSTFALDNVKMDKNSNPPLPQNETAVAASLDNPKVAVAASNDYVSGGNTVMYTADGGQTWKTIRVNPQFDGNREFCNGGDPWLAYSLRDHAFYMVQLCFFRTEVYSEVQLYKSVDNGHTWTPGRQSALVASNFNYTTGKVNAAIFHDNNQVTVDNNPLSPHYGRIYVTHVKFHMLPNGFSDYCPVQLDYTDDVPTFNPRLTVFHHTDVVPDQPGGPGHGLSANQWPRPQVETNGSLDIAYALEDCNSGLDRHFEMQKSSDGGNTFLPQPVRIDHRGEFRDNPNLADILPPTNFRAPASPGFWYNASTGVLGFDYQNNLDRTTSGANISFEQSTDGGLHWTHQIYISLTPSGAPAPNDQFFPSLTSLPDGTWVAIWLDRRNDPANTDIETFQATSSDGVTWSNQDISTAPWNPNLGFFKSGAFIGDYITVTASTTNIYPVWTDGRDTQILRTGIGNTDIFTNVEPIP